MSIKFPIMIHKLHNLILHQELLQFAMSSLGNGGFKLWCFLASDRREWIKLNVNVVAVDISLADGTTRNAIVELIEKGFLVLKEDCVYEFRYCGGETT